MKIVRFSFAGKKRFGVLSGETIQAIRGTPFNKIDLADEFYKMEEVKILAPVLPSKVVALGLNYLTHAREFNLTIPRVPLFFLKPSTSVIGPGDKIVYPNSSHRVDYEAELAVVIGRTAHYVSKVDAMNYVMGYTCLNDVTARDHQKEDGQWTRAKGFDTFCPIGPHIETDLNPDDLLVESYLNQQLKQSSRTSDLIFKIPELISFISHVMTLLPGDIIATGTSSGVGPMKPGDTIEIRIEKIGSLINTVVAH